MIEKLPPKRLSLIATDADLLDAFHNKIQELIDAVNAFEKTTKCTCPTEEDLGWEDGDSKHISSWDE